MSRGLVERVPNENDLSRLYYELAKLGAPLHGKRVPWPHSPRSAEQLLTIAAGMCRYDARLLTGLVAIFVARFREIHPVRLREAMAQMRAPQTLCVVMEFLKSASNDADAKHYAAYVQAGFRAMPNSTRFFIDSAMPGSRLSEKQLGRSLVEYSRWGFEATERPASDVYEKTFVGRYDAATRRRMLARYLDAHERITLTEYLRLVDSSLSRQQARQDLLAFGLVASGHGRGSRWSRLPI